jgi:hypothetical protein
LTLKKFYLNTPRILPENLCLKIEDISKEIIVKNNLHNIVTSNRYIYMEINKGMYGLPQVGLANKLLEQRLGDTGIHRVKSYLSYENTTRIV